jgi:hypothetical protein
MGYGTFNLRATTASTATATSRLRISWTAGTASETLAPRDPYSCVSPIQL